MIVVYCLTPEKGTPVYCVLYTKAETMNGPTLSYTNL